MDEAPYKRLRKTPAYEKLNNGRPEQIVETDFLYFYGISWHTKRSVAHNRIRNVDAVVEVFGKKDPVLRETHELLKYIDLSDGISSVADVRVDRFDGRPFSKHFNGSLTLSLLRDSSAVKENRKGLEEGDDLTEAIEGFIKESVFTAVSEVEDEQRRKERERRLSASNEKMKELSKFLHKCDVNFRRELKELKKRAIIKTKM